MSSICPKDFIACVDDMCRGSGVCLRTNTELLERCHRCHAVFGDDIECECEPDYDADDRDDEWEFDCGRDKHGNCGKAGSEECDFECPYRMTLR